MSLNYKKTILKTSLWTLLSLVVLLTLTIVFMILFFPKSLGNFCYSLGANGIASNLYYREYGKSGDIGSLYKCLNIEINEKNNDKIIKYYIEFTENNESTEFLKQFKERNEKLDIGLLEKSTMLNEENYLANKYIDALINTDQTRTAYHLSLELFSDYKDVSLKDHGIYSLGKFLNFADYTIIPENYEKTVILSMQEYFDISVKIFNDNILSEDNLTKVYLIALANRIIEVGQDINEIYTSNEMFAEISSNTLKMQEINNFIKGLL